MFVGLYAERMMQALPVAKAQPRGTERLLKLVDNYTADNVSDKVLRIILSYTDFVNRKVWHCK